MIGLGQQGRYCMEGFEAGVARWQHAAMAADCCLSTSCSHSNIGLPTDMLAGSAALQHAATAAHMTGHMCKQIS